MTRASMTPDVIDRIRRGATPARLVQYLRLDRAETRHPALDALDRRRASPPAETRLLPFLRIARGRSA